MTKAEVKKMIIIENSGCFKKAYYKEMNCGTYTKTWKNAEIKEDVYNELKKREMI